MPLVNYLRVTMQTASGSEPQAYRIEEGSSYREAIEEELQVNLSKFDVYVNDVLVNDLDADVQSGDVIRLQAKKYSSGAGITR